MPPMSEPEVFRKQMHCIEESICDIVGTFRRPLQPLVAPRSHLASPHSDSAPREMYLLSPLVMPLDTAESVHFCPVLIQE